MPRRAIALLLVVLAALAIALLLRGRAPEAGGTAAGAASGTTATSSAASPAETRHDRRARDELRRKVLEAWTRAAAEAGATAVDEPGGGGAASSPTVLAARAYGENQELDGEYIQHVMREELFPLARQCYEQLLERQPDAGGRVTLSYSIVGDAQLGGYVDDASIDAGAPDAIQDPEMQTCMRESMNSISFAPPKTGGAVTVEYPIEFAP